MDEPDDVYVQSPADKGGTKIHVKRRRDDKTLCRRPVTERWSTVGEEPSHTRTCASCRYERIRPR